MLPRGNLRVCAGIAQVEIACAGAARGEFEPPATSLDRDGHGTFIAGTVAEATNNRFALTGLAYGATIMPVRVLDATGSGSYANILQGIAESLLFYHPAVWWISGHIRSERELCCDDAAVSITGDVLTYARALAELESFRPAHANAVKGRVTK